MFRTLRKTTLATAAGLALAGTAFASSHMDAPLITLDDAANTTDVYAFRSDSPVVKKSWPDGYTGEDAPSEGGQGLDADYRAVQK